MIGEHRTGRRRAQAAVVAMLVASAACGQRDHLFHDARFVHPLDDEEYMELSSAMPNCGCVTLYNTRTDYNYNPDGTPKPGNDIWLDSEVFGAKAGGLLLPQGSDPVHVKYDWAGPGDPDRYRIYARVDKDGKPGERIKKASAYFDRLGTVVEGPCGETSCQFGPLGMNHATTALGTQSSVTHELGAHFANGGQVIAAESTEGKCGCVVLWNIGERPVSITASLLGVPKGIRRLDPKTADRSAMIFVGFDWAGTTKDHVYELSATAVDDVVSDAPTGQRGSAVKNSPPAGRVGNAIKISDNVQIVAQMSYLTCTDMGAEFAVPADTGDSTSTGGQQKMQVRYCPFAPFSTNEAYQLSKKK